MNGDKPLTDQQIHDLAYQEWLGSLESLWVAIGKPVDRDRLKIYAKTFEDVPLGLLEKAVKRVLLSNTYNIVPTIAAIRAAIHIELGEANCTDYSGWSHKEWHTQAEYTDHQDVSTPEGRRKYALPNR